MKIFSFLLLCCGISLYAKAQQSAIRPGMKISKSMNIKKNIYVLGSSNDKPSLLIEGDNIIIDFNDATIKGNLSTKNPDEFEGISIMIQNSKHVTIKNLKIRGYKIGLLAKNVQWLTLENCDISYNYRQVLNSTQEKEDISDWMSYHKNKDDEWLRYGAAIYLKECDNALIKNCTVTGGQNALMMMKSNYNKIYNNDFSFNSGIGIGLYNSSNNFVAYNRVIFNVRGYSHGVYNRGQDSAGMLVYEQSNDNIFYQNNVTHGGDGFFLWAGQTTMDKGTGGCNDNLIYQNDFSYAPTNGIEVTFSRNQIIGNKMIECDHGIWGGYSFDTRIEDNLFSQNRIAIAIEHGLHNIIKGNSFNNDKEAIRLWARKEQPADWAYARLRDTRSAGYNIRDNKFIDIPLVFNLNRTDTLNINDNQFSGTIQTKYKTDSTVSNLDSLHRKSVTPFKINLPVLPAEEKINNPFKGSEQLAGRKNIMITEWGPYDFRYPIAWNTNPTDTSGTLKFDILGPKGTWKIKSMKGIKNISSLGGLFPANISAEKIKSDLTDIQIVFEFVGESFTDAFGKSIPAKKPYPFSFNKFFQPMAWEVNFFSMDTSFYNPIKEIGLFSPLVRMAPFRTDHVTKLDYAWWGGIKTDVEHKQFITIAEANTSFLPGNYELSVTWDDAVKVYIDEKLILNEWNPALYKFDESPNRKIKIKLSGMHHFRVEHLELGGFATLSIKLKKL